MRLLEHYCDEVGDIGGVAWWVRCACGFQSGFSEDLAAVVMAYTSHVIAVLVVERPPDDVVETARRAFDNRRGR